MRYTSPMLAPVELAEAPRPRLRAIRVGNLLLPVLSVAAALAFWS